MSKKLAIRGHSTRGKEVIKLLEMMGGKNKYNYKCIEIRVGFTIGSDGSICRVTYNLYDEFRVFTLEEFLEKYPYKVGDKVTLYGISCTITWLCWECNNIYYYVQGIDVMFQRKVEVNQLKPYKETNMKSNKCTQCVYAVNNDHCGLRGFRSNFNVSYCSAQNVDKLPNGFELQEDGYFSWVNKKPTYPKTVIEVLDYWHPNRKPEDDYQYIYKKELVKSFQLLLYCRDAYWKMAGEEMGLGKPWEPNWTTFEGMPAIFTFRYNIVCDFVKNQHCLLVFPTEEMRDAFYENFKDLIEHCKELL